MNFLINTFKYGHIKNHTKIVVLICILYILAPISGIMFLFFLFTGSFTIINLNLNAKYALLMDAFLSVIFFLQHSIMIRRKFKLWLGKFMPKIYHNALYGLTSIITLMIVLVLWQKSSIIVAHAEGLVLWVMRMLFLLCLGGFVWGGSSLSSFDALGVKFLVSHIAERNTEVQQIMAKGPYRWVRHSLYFFLIIIIWSCPVLTSDRLLFNIMWTVWIVIGTYLEDRDLHREFGSQYRKYSSQVPMLIPYRLPFNKDY